MASIEFQMSVSSPSMVDGMPVCDLGKEGTWIASKGVKGKAING